MAIRRAQLGCLVNYDKRRELEQRSGKTITPRLTLDGVYGEAHIGLRSGEPQFQALFYLISDEVEYEGCVVDVERKDERLMSDVWGVVTYATVFHPEEVKFEHIRVMTDMGSGDDWHAARWDVDASPDVLDIYDVWKKAQQFGAALRRYDSDQQRLLDERRTVEKGKWVKVVRGRKVEKGTIGKVFWLQDQNYYGRCTTRIGIAVPREDGKLRTVETVGRRGNKYQQYADVEWTYAHNCAVINPETGRTI